MVKGFIRIFTDPVVGDIFLNNVYQGMHDVYLEIESGNYTVSFGDVKGFKTPLPVSVSVIPGTILPVIGRYT